MISSTSFAFSLSFPHTQSLAGTDGSSFKIETLLSSVALYSPIRICYYSRSIAESLGSNIVSLAKISRESANHTRM